MKMKSLLNSALLLTAAAPAFAHDGHEAAREIGILHWVTEADHLAVIAVSLTVAVLYGVLRAARRR